jgi:hypothetical protein
MNAMKQYTVVYVGYDDMEPHVAHVRADSQEEAQRIATKGTIYEGDVAWMCAAVFEGHITDLSGYPRT